MSESKRVDMSEWSGRFSEGWTDGDIDRELPIIGELLGLHVACMWSYRDEDGSPCGDSELVVIADGAAHELPSGLWDLLLDGEGDGSVDVAPGRRLGYDVDAMNWISPWQACA